MALLRCKPKERKDTDASYSGQGQTELQTELVPIKTNRCYKIVEPPKEKLLDPAFDIPDNKFGNAVKALLLLCRAEDEIAEDRGRAHQDVLNAMKDMKKTGCRYQLGKRLYELSLRQIEAKEEVKIKAC